MGKKDRSKRRVRWTDHHRKPKSHGGRKNKENISRVPVLKHRAWHVLFDNLTAKLVFKRFEEYWHSFGEGLSKIDFKARQANSLSNKQKAWLTLFPLMSIEEIVLEINTIWIDPRFELIITIEVIKTIKIVEKK